jgi:hypothetical protein
MIQNAASTKQGSMPADAGADCLRSCQECIGSEAVQLSGTLFATQALEASVQAKSIS